MFRIFFFRGASAIKSRAKSRIFRYGLPEDFFSKGQKTIWRGVVQRPPPCFRGLTLVFMGCKNDMGYFCTYLSIYLLWVD